MKKSLCVLFILILIFPIISAVEINILSEYKQGETAIASVSGNFVDSITRNNIYFYRGTVRTAFDYDIEKLGNQYYFYFQAGTKSPNNYSVVIKNTRYLEGTQIIQDEIKKDFIITSDTADFSVKPGAVITAEDFSLQVQNPLELETIIDIDTGIISGGEQGDFGFFVDYQEADSLNLTPDEINDIDIVLQNITETTIRKVILKSDNTEYEVPVYVIVYSYPQEPEEEQNQSEEQNETEESDEQEEEESEECTWFQKLFGLCGNEQEGEQEENETGQDNQTSENGEDNQTQEQNQTNNETGGQADNETTEDLNETEELNETQENETQENETEYEIIEQEDGTLIVIEDGEIVEVEATLNTCAEMKGYVCGAGEFCSTKTVYAKDNKCCVTKCSKEEEPQNNKLVAWVIIGALFIVIIWFFKSKFSKTKNKKDVLLGKK